MCTLYLDKKNWKFKHLNESRSWNLWIYTSYDAVPSWPLSTNSFSSFTDFSLLNISNHESFSSRLSALYHLPSVCHTKHLQVCSWSFEKKIRKRRNHDFAEKRLISGKTCCGLKHGLLHDERCSSHPITWGWPLRQIVTFFSGLQAQHVWGSYFSSRKDKCECVCWRLVLVINVKWMLKSWWWRYFQVGLLAAFRLFQLTLPRMDSAPPHLPAVTQTRSWRSALIHLRRPGTWKRPASEVDTF